MGVAERAEMSMGPEAGGSNYLYIEGSAGFSGGRCRNFPGVWYGKWTAYCGSMKLHKIHRALAPVVMTGREGFGPMLYLNKTFCVAIWSRNVESSTNSRVDSAVDRGS